MESNLSGGGSTFVKVMTDEQMEILREQIAVYASICEQLVEMHKSLTAHNDLAGSRLGNLYCDPFITSNNSHKITSRQRWSPSAKQLQILERIFNQGTNNPGKVKVPEITAELSQHGHVTETNVYNWFQNRRARSKRKQPSSAAVNGNAESELENEDEQSVNDKKKAEDTHHHQTASVPCSMTEDVVGSQSTDVDHFNGSKIENHELLFQEAGNGTFEDIQFYGIDHVIGNYNSYLQQDDCNITR